MELQSISGQSISPSLSDALVNTRLYPDYGLVTNKNPSLIGLETALFDKLRDHLLTIPKVQLGNYYFRAVLDSRDLYPILKLLSKDDRIELAKDFMEYAEDYQLASEFSTNYFAGMLHYLKADEKVVLLKGILDSALTLEKQLYLEEILRSAKDIKNLHFLVKASRLENIQIGRSAIQESVATAVIGTALLKNEVPDKPNKNASIASSEAVIKEIKTYLNNSLVLLEAHSAYRKTQTYREYKTGLNNILFYLKKMHPYSSRQIKGQKPATELRQLACDLIEMCDILFRYKISLTIKDPKSKQTKNLRAWNSEQIEAVKKAIGYIGAGKILHTPLLFEIRRVGTYDSCGRRELSGPIIISDHALDEGPSRIYPNSDSFEMVLYHELAHAEQLGKNGGKRVLFDKHTGFVTGPADERACFTEFARLSDWKVIDKRHYKMDKDLQTVTINKERYKLGVPEILDGERRILLYSECDDQLLSRDASARFGYRRDFDTTPEEDYVESRTDYGRMSEKAIEYSPDKFLFFERRERFYDNNNAKQKKLTESLRKLMGDVLTINDLLRASKKIVERRAANIGVAPTIPVPNLDTLPAVLPEHPVEPLDFSI